MTDFKLGLNGSIWFNIFLEPEDIEKHRSEIGSVYKQALANQNMTVQDVCKFLDDNDFALFQTHFNVTTTYRYANDAGLVVETYFFRPKREVTVTFTRHNAESAELLKQRCEAFKEVAEMAKYESCG